MKRFFWIIILTVTTAFINKSKAQLFDSLQQIIKSKASIDLRLESRYSFINNELAAINGIRIGASFRRKLRFGGGISWLKSDLYDDIYIPNSNGDLISNRKFLRLGYVCLYADVVFYKTKRWQVSVPIQTGLGLSWYQFNDSYNLNSQPKYFLWIYEPGISTHFKIFKWLGLGMDVNYRFTLKNNKNISEQFSSPTYALKFLFWADQLFYDLFPNSKITEKRGPAQW
ncbi:MAG TPA: hypothetical protein PLC65_02130 [Bacteroidia bacterium]|nr:hypothetical protein [Bacteroidia bacterium]HRD37405.1 hypothetical protein [Bacteroidia bacterium]